MKRSPFTLLPALVLVLGLAAPAWAQDRPADPGEGGVRQDSPGRQAVEEEDDPEPSEEEFELPEIEYPEPVTEAQKKAAGKHQEGSQNLAIEQDELSADVQNLIEEQTDEKVIQLLEQVEEIMAEVIDSLDQTETGGATIAAETEIIEKIFEAAQQRAQQQGDGSGSPSSGAMLDMMQRMMGREPQPGQGQQPGQGAGETGGEGQTGESDTPNSNPDNGGEGTKAERRFEKAGGQAGSGLPPEFQKALDAYNKSR